MCHGVGWGEEGGGGEGGMILYRGDVVVVDDGALPCFGVLATVGLSCPGQRCALASL